MELFFKPLDHTVATAVDTRCNQKLLWHGYTYNYHITLKNDKGTSWRCMRSKKAYDGQYCHAIATTFADGNVKQKDEHIHEPQYEQNEMAYMKSQFLAYLEMKPDCNLDEVIMAAARTLPRDKRVAGECLLRRVLSTYQYKDGKMRSIKSFKRKCQVAIRESLVKRARHDPPRKAVTPDEASDESDVPPVAETPVVQVQKKSTVPPEVAAAVPKPAVKVNDTPLCLFGKSSMLELIEQMEQAQAMNKRYPLLKPGAFRPSSSTVPKPSAPMGPPRLLVPIGLPRPVPGSMHSIPIIMPRASTSIRTIGSIPLNSTSSPRTTLPPAANRTPRSAVAPKTEVEDPSTLTAEKTTTPSSSARTTTTTIPDKNASTTVAPKPSTTTVPSTSRKNSRPMAVPKTEIITLSPEPPIVPASKTMVSSATPKTATRASAVNFAPRRWVSPLAPSNAISTAAPLPTSRVGPPFPVFVPKKPTTPTVAASRERIRTIIGSYIPH